MLNSLSAVLSPKSPLSDTYFPPTYDLMKALKDFHELQPGDDFSVGSTHIRTYPLNHPGGCLAFRLENAGRVFVFATDHEQPQVPDPGLASFAHGADLLYTEGQYLQTEYDGKEAVPGDAPMCRRGWGHSPMEACVATAVAARRASAARRPPRAVARRRPDRRMRSATCNGWPARSWCGGAAGGRVAPCRSRMRG